MNELDKFFENLAKNGKVNWGDYFNKIKDKKICYSPSHDFPMHLYIPFGQSHTHTCPACGAEQTVMSPNISF